MAVRKTELWGKSEFDQIRSSVDTLPHAAAKVESITLRNNAFPHMEGFLCYWQDAYKDFPEFIPMIFDLARIAHAEMIGRIMFTKVPMGGAIATHTDEGFYCNLFDRFHLCIESTPEASFTSGVDGDMERVIMRPGEVWWVNNKIPHSVDNSNSLEDRIHLIIDLKVK